MTHFDILIPAHGETLKQIETLLYLIHLQKTPENKIEQILLCSDQPRIEEAFADRSHLTFIPQAPRLGKPNALNRMLQESTAPFCIQNSADCLPASERTYHYLLKPLEHESVGAVTSQPIPFNQGFMNLPNIVWRVHEFVQPKLNAELFSFKNMIDSLPEDVIHDDSFIHYLFLRKQLQVVYEPRATVFNRVPSIFTEFYQQRKKNVLGNMQLGDKFKIQPIKNIRLRSLILMSLELLANVHGRLDYVRNKIPEGLVGYNLNSTKEVIK